VANASVTYTFIPDTTIKASEANINFANLVNFLNSNVVQKDASLAFTNIPSGPSTNPTTSNQFTRKAYVDDLVSDTVGALNRVVGISSSTHPGTFGSGAAPIPSSEITYTFDPARRYRFTASVLLSMTSGTGYVMSVYRSGEQVRLDQDNGANTLGHTAYGSYVLSGLSGSLTHYIGIRTVSGGGTLLGGTQAHQFVIEDLGPIS
jgi:hypothetical protein